MSIDGTSPLLEPFYFRTDKPLYGCYHRPQCQPAHQCAVVLCYPMGDEYIRFYRAVRQTASQLATAGFPVLRFDFYGCGDSAGEAEEWRLPQWQADLALAITEARRRSGSPHVALAGLRLGATLAATVAAARGDIIATVLWDPIFNGQAHLQELQGLHASMLRRAHVLPHPPDHDGPAEPVPEIMGYPLTPAFHADVAALDLLALSARPAPRILLVESNPQVNQTAFAEHLRRLGASVEHRASASPHLWSWLEGVDTVIVPNSILQAIPEWLAEVCP